MGKDIHREVREKIKKNWRKESIGDALPTLSLLPNNVVHCSVSLARTLTGPLEPRCLRPCSWDRCRRCWNYLSLPPSSFIFHRTDFTLQRTNSPALWGCVAQHLVSHSGEPKVSGGRVHLVYVYTSLSLLSAGALGDFRGNFGDRCSSMGFTTTEIIQTVTRTSRTSCQVLEGM